MLKATNPIRKPQVCGRSGWPGTQELVQCRPCSRWFRRGEEVEVVSYGAVRQMEGTNANVAFEQFCANEVLTSFVDFRLLHIAYPAEVEVSCFPTNTILGGQVFTDWRNGRVDAYVITRAQ